MRLRTLALIGILTLAATPALPRDYITPNGVLIGRIYTRIDGTRIVENANHRMLGYYDPRMNLTFDSMNRVHCRGDCLITFIH
jgi:hypothetical protein